VVVFANNSVGNPACWPASLYSTAIAIRVEVPWLPLDVLNERTSASGTSRHRTAVSHCLVIALPEAGTSSTVRAFGRVTFSSKT
jgi:hypothetical protein